MDGGFNDLERAVLAITLEGDEPWRAELRSQLAVATFGGRELTGVGFYTTLALHEGVEPAAVPPQTMPLDGVVADVAGLVRGAGFLVWVREGRLHQLEGFTYDEVWLDPPPAFTLHRTRVEGTRVVLID